MVHSFPNRLAVILVATILIPVMLINILMFNSIKKEMQSDAAAWLQGMAQNTGETMDSYIQLLKGLTRNPSYDYTLNQILERHISNREGLLGYSYEDTAQINGWMSMMLETDRDRILSVELFDRNGNRFRLGSDIRDSNADWMESARGLEGGTYVFKPVYDRSGQPLFAIARLLYNPSTFREVGMIRMHFRLDFTLDDDQEIKNRGVKFYLADENDQVIFDSQQLCSGAALSECMGTGETVSRYQSTSTSWTLATSIPKDQLFRDIDRLQQIFMLAHLFFFLTALLIIFSVSYRISYPLKRLSRLMLTASKHQFRIDIPESGRSDEIGIMTASFRTMIARMHALFAEVVTTEQRRKRAEIASLQAQINPHFLYNTLSAIVMQAEIDGNITISTMTSRLGKLLRYSIGKEKEWVTVASECAHIAIYIEVMKYRYPKVELELDVDERVLEKTMIKVLLQPIVENGIIHGIVPNGLEGVIHIAIQLHDEYGDAGLLIQISDNGVGMEPERLEELKQSLTGVDGGESIGIRNVYERIQLAYNTKGRTSFDIQSRVGQGTTFTIILPGVDDESRDRG